MMRRTSHFRHFAAADSPPDALPASFTVVDVPGLYLCVHEASDWHLERSGEDWVFLTGTVFHLEETLDMSGLASRLIGAASPLDEIDHWVGAFAALHHKDGRLHAYRDAAAGSKVYFRTLPDGTRWLGSEPQLSKHWAPLEPHSDEGLRTLHASHWWRKRETFIAHVTPFEGVTQVIANHRFDWERRMAERIFPRADRQEMTPEAAIDYLLPRLRHVFRQATATHRVHLALTAGWDSRLALAASSQVRSDLHVYTFHRKTMKVDSPDLTIPARIARGEGFQHDIIETRPDIDPDTVAAIRESFTFTNPYRFNHLLTLFPGYDPRGLVLVGTVSEVGKNYLERVPFRNAREAVRAVHLVEHPWIVAHYDRWLEESAPVIRRHGYSALDFMHWEQDVTNFAGKGMQNGGFASKHISPFNCTKVLEVLLSVNPKLRDHHHPRFYGQFIDRAWPELMRYPVNPFRKEDAIRLAKRLRVYDTYKMLDNRIRPRPFKG